VPIRALEGDHTSNWLTAALVVRGPVVQVSELYVEAVGVHGELHSVTLLRDAIELKPVPARVTDEPPP
jgi:sirohydrochlorin ferrochelatase